MLSSASASVSLRYFCANATAVQGEKFEMDLEVISSLEMKIDDLMQGEFASAEERVSCRAGVSTSAPYCRCTAYQTVDERCRS